VRRRLRGDLGGPDVAVLGLRLNFNNQLMHCKGSDEFSLHNNTSMDKDVNPIGCARIMLRGVNSTMLGSMPRRGYHPIYPPDHPGDDDSRSRLLVTLNRFKVETVVSLSAEEPARRPGVHARIVTECIDANDVLASVAGVVPRCIVSIGPNIDVGRRPRPWYSSAYMHRFTTLCVYAVGVGAIEVVVTSSVPTSIL
jgi:hypothetical protein